MQKIQFDYFTGMEAEQYSFYSEDGMERAENYHADHRFSDRQFK